MDKKQIRSFQDKIEQFELWDIAGSFCKGLALAEQGIYPEIQFDDGHLPTDDCFKTLAAVQQALRNTGCKDFTQELNDLQIRKLLDIPYTQVMDTISLICRIFDYPEYVVYGWYEKNIELFFVNKEAVSILAEYFEELFEKSMYRFWFKEAMILGVSEARRRMDVLLDATGLFAKEVLYEMYCRNGKQGYLFYPYYTDPVAAIQCLSNRFDREMVAHILKNDFWYLYAYKNETYHTTASYGHDQRYIDAVIKAYEEQEEVADNLMHLYAEITPYDYDEQWEEKFLPAYNAIEARLLQYPAAPKLLKAITAVVTAFKRCGVTILGRLSYYCIE